MPNLATPADFAACKAWIARHSKSFYLSSLLLPRQVRLDAWALYAFCRRADDAVDDLPQGEGQESLSDRALLDRRVQALRARLQRVYRGELEEGPDYAIDRAFADVVRRAQIDQALPARLLRGMEMDVEGTPYRTWDDLLDYCFNVAATVGLMMTAVMGHAAPAGRHGEVMTRAADLGVAMQLTNIARDVGEDARRGRVYLPAELLADHGTSAAEVLHLAAVNAPPTPGLRAAVAELLRRAAGHYWAADQGIVMLPRSCQLAIRASRRIYAAIGDEVAAADHDSLTRRAVVSLPRKLWLLTRALADTLGGPPRLPEARTSGPADPLLLRLCGEVGALKVLQ
jgi:phytoene synthase